MKKNCYVTEINLDNNEVPDSFIKKIESELEQNQKIQDFIKPSLMK